MSLLPSTALYHTQTDKEQWRTVGATIEQDAEPGDYVLVVDRITARGVRYYSDRSDITVRGVAVEGSGTGRAPAPTSEFENLTAGEDRIWVVFSHAPKSERHRVLNVVNDSRSMVRHEQYEKVELYLFVSEGNESNSLDSVPDAPSETNRQTSPPSAQRQRFAAPL